VTVKSLRSPASRQAGSRAADGAFSAGEGLAFVRHHGVVLVSAKGKGSNLVEAIAGETIKGSWWGHAEGKRIFSVLKAIADSDDVLVCRLIDGKVTLVHRRLWPALVRLARDFPPERISQVLDGHTASGRHVSSSVAFPDWVPPQVVQEAAALGEDEARSLLAEWLPLDAAGRSGRK
jgi:hypothetical protein